MPVIGLAIAFAALTTGSTPAALASTTDATTTVIAAPQTPEEYVREQFKDAPVMIRIASCESHFHQTNQDGTVLRNRQGSSAVGVFQIMSSIHAGAAKNLLGADIYTLKGNAAYARYLYETKGTSPWNDSKGCWNSTAPIAANINLQ